MSILVDDDLLGGNYGNLSKRAHVSKSSDDETVRDEIKVINLDELILMESQRKPTPQQTSGHYCYSLQLFLQ